MRLGEIMDVLIPAALGTAALWAGKQPNPKKAMRMGFGAVFGAIVLVYAVAYANYLDDQSRARKYAECQASAQRIGEFRNPMTGQSAPIMTCPRE
jgi:hypothetical protein